MQRLRSGIGALINNPQEEKGKIRAALSEKENGDSADDNVPGIAD
jgi:hypothetical protein